MRVAVLFLCLPFADHAAASSLGMGGKQSPPHPKAMLIGFVVGLSIFIVTKIVDRGDTETLDLAISSLVIGVICAALIDYLFFR